MHFLLLAVFLSLKYFLRQKELESASVAKYYRQYLQTKANPTQEELEKVQNRAARFLTGNYVFETGSMTGILGQLK